MQIPAYPQSDQPVSADWGRRIIDCLRELDTRMPSPGKTARHAVDRPLGDANYADAAIEVPDGTDEPARNRSVEREACVGTFGLAGWRSPTEPSSSMPYQFLVRVPTNDEPVSADLRYLSGGGETGDDADYITLWTALEYIPSQRAFVGRPVQISRSLLRNIADDNVVLIQFVLCEGGGY